MMMGAGASRIFRRRAMANDFEAGTKKEGSGIAAPWETIGHSLLGRAKENFVPNQPLVP